MKFSSSLYFGLGSLSVITLAHPGQHETFGDAELLRKRELYGIARRNLANCEDHIQTRAIMARAEARRIATFEKHAKRSLDDVTKDRIHARSTSTILNKSHLSSKKLTASSSDATIFGTSSSVCVLNPQGEVGPFYVKGEHIRLDLRDGQPGVPLIIDGQFLNSKTCKPITNLYWDIWNANATGVYSGVTANGNGNTADRTNINKSFLRGIQKADSDGVVQFKTIFPGHYTGRTTHHHVVAHLGASVLANGTLTGGTVAHIGQLFWDQSLITKVEATYPYNTNKQTITKNSADRVFGVETADSTSDPVFNYVMLGKSLSDGIFGWITMVIDVSTSYDPTYSFQLTSKGGVAVGSSSGAGGNSAQGGSPSHGGGQPNSSPDGSSRPGGNFGPGQPGSRQPRK